MCADNDSDGFGNPGDSSCLNGAATDCNDNDSAVNEGAVENCTDGIDNDCDGYIDYLDSDCAQTYKFSRMWPTLQQPWYFLEPWHITLDNNRFVFVADTKNNRIQKFSPDGIFITKWGSDGTGDGQFILPRGIEADSNGFIYVVDYGNNRIQKFSPDGAFITKWGSYGNGEGQFDSPYGIAVDSRGFVYVTDEGNNRIQKFNPDGMFISQWGGYGTGNGKFIYPAGIAIDSQDNIYITDYDNSRIQKFSPDGVFITKWGSYGNGDGQFNSPYGITVDNFGFVYVTENGNDRIQKFSSDGVFITKWGSIGNGDGEFYYPAGIFADNEFIYVADAGNDRIQKFSSDGVFITKWGSIGNGDGEFYYPYGMAADISNYIYVTDDENHRVQKFTQDGVFITKWGSKGSGNGRFNCPTGIAVYKNDSVYVADFLNSRIQKFTPDGVFITKWGSRGNGDGKFDSPYGIAVDSNGFVYVADSGNNRIQKFSPDGVFILKWGTYGTEDGDFRGPHDIAVDSDDNIYVSDEVNNRIQKFTPDGAFIEKWGGYGEEAGEFNRPWGIDVDSSGFVYVTDGGNQRIQKFTAYGQFVTQWGNSNVFSFPSSLSVSNDGRVFTADVNNNRIQVFKQTTLSSKNKAIIVAAGGPYEGNKLWDATQMNANFAYQTLIYQGFTKESIFYMSADTDLDLDNNSVFDDIDSAVTIAALQDAITYWAADAYDLVIYLVDHGGDGTLRMNDIEMLSSTSLDEWLDNLQSIIPGRVTVIYDACESGSFLSALTPPIGKERIIISSTSPGESAYFVNHGSVSFSSFFWTNIFNGKHLNYAFDMAVSAISQAIPNQTPLLDDTGNGIGNEPTDGALAQNTYIGNGTITYGNVPIIGSISPSQTINGSTSAAISANDVIDADGIARVWAVVIPPGFSLVSADNAVQGLPYFDLAAAGGNLYEATYDKFNIEGTYQVAIYAKDRIGNTSIPKLTTVSVGTPLTRKAIILAGGSQADNNWQAIEKGALSAYNALTFQGYTDEDIYFMSPVSFSSGVDGLSVISNLSYAINTWAAGRTLDVVLYMIGNGDNEAYKINNTETLSAADLDTWLDNLQNIISGKVTVVYDANQSGSFLPMLTAPAGKERLILASTAKDQPAFFISNGDISFSRYFWIKVLNGINVRDAFNNARQAMSFTSGQRQTAVLDDTGNGIGNETDDGVVSRNYTIGTGIQLAGNDPLIGSVMADQVLQGQTSLTLWADGVTTTGTIEKVWALITPPGYITGSPAQSVTALPELILSNSGSNRYEGTYNDFSTFGLYHITIYAMDIDGNISTVKETIIHQTDAPDMHENDDTYNQATIITLNDPNPQQHNFHDSGDADWIMFYGLADETYEIKIENIGSANDTILELYDADGATLLAQVNNPGFGVEELLSYTFTNDGIYYGKVIHSNQSVFGSNTSYDLKVYIPSMPNVFGLIAGTVTDSVSSAPLGNVVVSTNYGLSDISRENGVYIMYHPSGTYSLISEKGGYNSYIGSFTITGSETVTKNIAMTASTCTDVDGDGFGSPGNAVCVNGIALDCNDSISSINPGAIELCDFIDNDCDGLIDDSDPDVSGQSIWYPDNDNDGFGNGSISLLQCDQLGYTLNNTDCNDSDSNIYPGGPPIRIAYTVPEYYPTLQDAYNNADDGDIIQSKAVSFTQHLSFDLGKYVSFEGGLDCSFSTQAGNTIINGSIINNGSVSLENFSLE